MESRCIGLNVRSSLSKTVYAFLVLLILPSILSATGKVSVYVSAHEDDWQLFMGVNAYNDIANSSDSSRVVIIYVTAGDFSDCINASDTNAVPYFLAREQGAKNSVQLAADSHKDRFVWKNDTVIVNHHLLIRSTYHFVTCYFLRLADGGMDGERNISLKNFRNNRFSNNYSIDSLTYYKDIADLSQTCNNILLNEIKNGEEVSLNLFDTDSKYNLNDHSDHHESALLFSEAMSHTAIKVLLFEGYNSGRASHLANLSGIDIMKESGLFAAYNQAMENNHYPSIWNNEYLRFCGSNYYRTVSDNNDIELKALKTILVLLVLVLLGAGLIYLIKKK